VVNREKKIDREALIRRLTAIRASTRGYQDILTKHYQLLTSGTQVGIEDFENDLAVAHSELNSAFDEALVDGVWFAHARQASFLIPPSSSILPAVGGLRGQGIDTTVLVDALREAADLVRACVNGESPIPESLRGETEQALAEVEAARGELVVYIKGRVDGLSVE